MASPLVLSRDAISASEVGKLLRALLCVGDPERLLLVVVEVARVTRTLALGNEWGLNLKYQRQTVLKLLLGSL